MRQKTILWLAFVAFIAIFYLTAQHNPVPNDRNEWTERLQEPVLALPQKAYGRSLPDQVLKVFNHNLLRPVYYPASQIKHLNNLPGSVREWNWSAQSLSWPLSDDNDAADNEIDPKKYLYIIDYDGELLALSFPDSVTLRCRKLVRPKDKKEPRQIVPSEPKVDMASLNR